MPSDLLLQISERPLVPCVWSAKCLLAAMYLAANRLTSRCCGWSFNELEE